MFVRDFAQQSWAVKRVIGNGAGTERVNSRHQLWVKEIWRGASILWLSCHGVSFPPLLSECARQFLARQSPGVDGILAAPARLVITANCPTDAGARCSHGDCRHMATISYGERGKGLEWTSIGCLGGSERDGGGVGWGGGVVKDDVCVLVLASLELWNSFEGSLILKLPGLGVQE